MKLMTKERQKQGLTKLGLAYKVGTHPSTISRIEGGREVPYTPMRQKIADALSWDGNPDDLFVEVEE